MTLSTPFKLALLGAVVAGLAALGYTQLLARHAQVTSPIVVPIHHHAVAVVRHPKPRAAASPDATLPPALRHALTHHRVVVAVLYAPGVPGEKAAVQAARQGAHDAHVGFTTLNVSNEAVAKAIALKLPGSSDPSVLVVARPGKIVTLLAGSADRAVVLQAAHDAS